MLFGHQKSFWSETRQVLAIKNHFGVKPGGFWSLKIILERNPVGFGH